MLAELLRRLLSHFRLIFNLLSKPDPQFENPLNLLGLVEPATTIADRVSGKIVIWGRFATEGMGRYVVCFPLIAFYRATADVALAARLGTNFASFTDGKRLPDQSIA